MKARIWCPKPRNGPEPALALEARGITLPRWFLSMAQDRPAGEVPGGAGDVIIRTDKGVTITEAHPYHVVVTDTRDRGGSAVVRAGYDPACPLCRAERGP